jgi:hypothetical protein
MQTLEHALQIEALADDIELRRAAAKTLKGFCATYLAHHFPRQEKRQTRLLMSEQLGDSISWPFLTVLVFWICALFLGFALFARFIEHIAWQLMRIARGEIKRLIINVPPRSRKSAMVSVAFTAWLLGHDPAKRITACT